VRITESSATAELLLEPEDETYLRHNVVLFAGLGDRSDVWSSADEVADLASDAEEWRDLHVHASAD
jgi:hypothetical protein